MSLLRRRTFNSSLPGQNGRHFADDIFKCIFLNEKLCILTRTSPKFVPEGPVDNTSASVHVMAWRRTGDKPLHEPMLTQFTDAYMRHSSEMSFNWNNTDLLSNGPLRKTWKKSDIWIKLHVPLKKPSYSYKFLRMWNVITHTLLLYEHKQHKFFIEL